MASSGLVQCPALQMAQPALGSRGAVVSMGLRPRQEGLSCPSGSSRSSAFFAGQRRQGLDLALRTRVGAAGAQGGALGAQMNIFERVARIVKSYTNAALSAVEDPEKLLDQTVEDMQNDLAKLRQATAQVLASTKQLENKYKQAAQNSQDWMTRAKLALSKNEEELAKEALKRRKEYEDNAKSLESQLSQQQQTVDKLIANTRLLEGKIQEARAKKDTLKARAQSAKTQQKVNEMLGNINTTSSFAAFEKMEEKVMALEAESEAVSQISSDELSNKFALLESGDVDDDLEALKKEMLLGDSKSAKAALPSGKASTGASLKDLEIEAELAELRRKAKGL